MRELNAYLKSFKKSNVRLNKEEELKHIKEAQNGSTESMRLLIETNILYILNIAKRHFNCGLSEVDLMQEGIMGFMRAVNKFDLNNKNNIRSYAFMWVQKYITDAIATQASNVRLPMNKELDRYLANKNGEDWSLGKEVKLDNPVSDESKKTLGDLIARTDSSIFKKDEDDYNKYLVKKILSRFNELEQNIIKDRYGVDGYYELKGSDIAKKHNVSNSYVTKVLKKFKECGRTIAA